MLTIEIAETIINETMRRLNRNINIMDESGTIIASGDPHRVNQFHEGSIEVLRTGTPLVITEETKHQWRGSQAGINLPIEFENKTIGVIGISGNQQDVEEFGELVKMTTEMMIKQAFIASQMEWKQRAKDTIIEELIKSYEIDQLLTNRLDLLGLKLQPPYHVFIIQLEAQHKLLLSKLEERLNSEHDLIGYLDANRIFILASTISFQKIIDKIIAINKVLKHFTIENKIGIGSTVHQLEDISMSYKEASIALLFDKNEETPFYSFTDIQAQALIYSVNANEKQRFLERILNQLSDKHIHTLKTFFACNQNITETSKKLYIHRNTLIYRLKKVKEETGFDPQVFTDAINLQLGVWIYYGASAPLE